MLALGSPVSSSRLSGPPNPFEQERARPVEGWSEAAAQASSPGASQAQDGEEAAPGAKEQDTDAQTTEVQDEPGSLEHTVVGEGPFRSLEVESRHSSDQAASGSPPQAPAEPPLPRRDSTDSDSKGAQAQAHPMPSILPRKRGRPPGSRSKQTCVF